MKDGAESRRKFVKRAAYVPPAILTLSAVPAFAKAGSVKPPKDRPPRDRPPRGRHGHDD